LKDENNQTNVEAFHFTIQELVVLALGRASAGTADAVPALREVLAAAETEGMRAAAARALGEVGPEARPAAGQLRQLLRANSSDVQRAAREALEKVGASPGEEQARDAGPARMELPEGEREYLWEIEHHGNVLARRGFGPLAEALKKGDTAALSRILADDFAGTDLGEPRRVRVATDYAEVERLEDAGRPAVPLGRNDFVARLLGFRQVFAGAAPKAKLKLMTLRPRDRGRFDGPWEGTALLRLYGEHAPGKPAEVAALLRYEVARPTEERLAQPGWLRSAGVLQAQTARAPRYLFAEVARQRGLDSSWLHDNWKAPAFLPLPGGVYVCDFDRDGILDVLLTDANGTALYRGRPGGAFEDVTERYGLPRLPSGTTTAAWVDLDGDGWDDLLLAGRVYRNDGGRRFADYTSRSNLRLPPNPSAIVVADYDRDGRLDLYVTSIAPPGSDSWLSGRSGDSPGNRLFRNKGGWQFEDVTRASGTRGGGRSTFTAAWLDANNDGWPDLHVINEFGDGVLLVNKQDGTFAEHPLADRPADFGSMGLAVGDVNNDGHIDIYCANMYSKAGTRVIGNLRPDAYPPEVLEKMRRFVAGSQLHLNRGGLKFEQAGARMQVAAVGWAYGACLADLDNDGWLDVYATAGFVSRDRDEPDG
ncbi:MAG TPA: FG-GAP-like repeat-containing protein, partial [Gemmataceae bacterium]|nr:FG-GAP-like repeat-containing protein [Gemmataceae bacterium]